MKTALSIIFILLPSLSYSFNYDAYLNYSIKNDLIYDLNEYRKKGISEMNDIIYGECSSVYFSGYVENTLSTRMKIWSGEIPRSQMNLFLPSDIAMLEMVNNLSRFYKFPMSYYMLKSFEEVIDDKANELVKANDFNTYTGTEQIINLCTLRYNPKKYFNLLSNKNLTNEESYFASSSGIKNKTDNNLIPLISDERGGVDVSSQEIKEMGLSEQELLLAKAMLGDDIKAGLVNQGKDNWLLHHKILEKRYSDFLDFIKSGGKNEAFLKILVMVKTISVSDNVLNALKAIHLGESKKLIDIILETPNYLKNPNNQKLIKRSKSKLKSLEFIMKYGDVVKV